ncbi:MAG: GNAT family N-acetyltransferase [Oscillospiraceae bacterium]|nr:GNAT family N-acetyltransferase [Oscillospiraceae bacterium]
MDRKIYIQNDILCLAACEESDYQILYASWLEQETVLGYNWRIPYSFEEYRLTRQDAPWAAVIMRRTDNAVIGRIGLSVGSLPDLTIAVFAPCRRQGYGTIAFSLGVQYCFEILKLDRIYAGCYEDNTTSLAMLKKCGFQPHPEGNVINPHIITGEDRVQLDFVRENRTNIHL